MTRRRILAAVLTAALLALTGCGTTYLRSRNDRNQPPAPEGCIHLYEGSDWTEAGKYVGTYCKTEIPKEDQP